MDRDLDMHRRRSGAAELEQERERRRSDCEVDERLCGPRTRRGFVANIMMRVQGSLRGRRSLSWFLRQPERMLLKGGRDAERIRKETIHKSQHHQVRAGAVYRA